MIEKNLIKWWLTEFRNVNCKTLVTIAQGQQTPIRG